MYGSFLHPFYEGSNLCDFLFASLHDSAYSKWDLLKGKIFFSLERSNLFSLKVDPNWLKGMETENGRNVFPENIGRGWVDGDGGHYLEPKMC